MDTKDRIGSDPLSWIRDTREETGESKQEGRSTQRVITKSSQEGLREGWTRATFIVREEHLEKLKALAYWERKQLKELVDEVLSSYLKHKKVKPVKKEEK
jgi:hypothetical protein